MMWHQFNDGKSLGQRGSENGIIIRDEEHLDGSRITLERDGYTPFAITCGIYGWMVHTRFFPNEEEAQQAFNEMKGSLGEILEQIPLADDPEVTAKMDEASQAISNFVEQYP